MIENNLYLEFNNIIVDEHEFDDINICMTDIQKRRLKHNLRKYTKKRRHLRTKIAVACAAFSIFLIGVCYTNPTLAAQFPILNPIVELLGRTGDYEKYSAIINKTITQNGSSFTINSVVCFDNNIVIGYTAKSDEKINQRGTLFWPIFKVNGRTLDGGSQGLVKNIDENTIIGTILLTAKSLDLPNSFNFDMSFNGFNTSEGKWNFKFNILKAESSKNIKIYTKNQEISYDKYNFTIKKVTLTPFNTIVSIHSKNKNLVPDTTNLFIMLDDESNIIQPSDIQADSVHPNSSGGFDYTFLYSKANSNTKYLTLIPYKYHEKQEGNNYNSAQGPIDEALPISTKLPFKLNEGKHGKVEIDQITYSNDRDNVIIKGVIYGRLPNNQFIRLEGENFNPAGDLYPINNSIRKIESDKYEFVVEYKGLKSDKNYKIIAPNLDYYIDYDSEIKITLDN
ncbi:DUF4179 domain-containing protein [Candidatus Clostridium radicumherbarum]|uniref:DUF4179 domain-containing protein n=1 Tax=Candidatus Clostridium radicumherbarum TaxID=3381662 RepID=A0ABW8TS25_9CLOT